MAHPWISIDSWLRLRNLSRVSVLGDGNCQFRAVAFHSPLDHVALRSAAVQFVDLHRPLFQDFLIAHNVDAYIRRMSQASHWGDHISLVALACVLNRPIHVVSIDGLTVWSLL